jgi:AcrR family transcriptional regulator
MARKTTRRKAAGSRGGRGAAAAASAATPLDRAIDAAMQLAATQGWRDTTLADIAETAGLSLGELRRVAGGKTEILQALSRRADAAMLDAGPAEGESVRDKVFELLMRRLDALSPFKPGLKAVSRDLARDPGAAARLACGTARSMAWTLEAAGVNPRGPIGGLRVNALAAIYAYTLRGWLNDESADNAKTMAALDKALRRAESLASPFSRRAQAAES